MVRQLAIGHPWGGNPMSDTALVLVGAIVILFTLGLSGALVFLRMTTTVTDEDVTVRFWAIRLRRVPLSQISDLEAVNVNSFRELGRCAFINGLV